MFFKSHLDNKTLFCFISILFDSVVSGGVDEGLKDLNAADILFLAGVYFM